MFGYICFLVENYVQQVSYNLMFLFETKNTKLKSIVTTNFITIKLVLLGLKNELSKVHS